MLVAIIGGGAVALIFALTSPPEAVVLSQRDMVPGAVAGTQATAVVIVTNDGVETARGCLLNWMFSDRIVPAVESASFEVPSGANRTIAVVAPLADTPAGEYESTMRVVCENSDINDESVRLSVQP